MIVNSEMTSVCKIPQVYNNLEADLKRRILIFSRKGLVMSTLLSVFIERYFFVENGQIFVIVDEEQDEQTAEGRLLLNYPKKVAVRTKVDAIIPLSVPEPKAVMPFDTGASIEFQSIGVAGADVLYDYAMLAEGERTRTACRYEGEVYFLETYSNGVLDIMKGPEHIEKKPFNCRRHELKRLKIQVVPETTDLSKAILIKDGDGYMAGSTGGYYRYTGGDLICVRREVVAKEAFHYVRGCMTMGNDYTLIMKCDTDDPEGESKVQINLRTQTVVGYSLYINDVFDYYTLRYSLPQSVSDVRIRDRKGGTFDVVVFTCTMSGAVQEVGFRSRIYGIMRHMNGVISIRNVERLVVVSGLIVDSDYDAMRYKLDSFAFVNKAKVEWKFHKNRDKKIPTWAVVIET